MSKFKEVVEKSFNSISIPSKVKIQVNSERPNIYVIRNRKSARELYAELKYLETHLTEDDTIYRQDTDINGSFID